jgi:hypothetical protein
MSRSSFCDVSIAHGFNAVLRHFRHGVRFVFDFLYIFGRLNFHLSRMYGVIGCGNVLYVGGFLA